MQISKTRRMQELGLGASRDSRGLFATSNFDASTAICPDVNFPWTSEAKGVRWRSPFASWHGRYGDALDRARYVVGAGHQGSTSLIWPCEPEIGSHLGVIENNWTVAPTENSSLETATSTSEEFLRAWAQLVRRALESADSAGTGVSSDVVEVSESSTTRSDILAYLFDKIAAAREARVCSGLVRNLFIRAAEEEFELGAPGEFGVDLARLLSARGAALLPSLSRVVSASTPSNKEAAWETIRLVGRASNVSPDERLAWLEPLIQHRLPSMRDAVGDALTEIDDERSAMIIEKAIARETQSLVKRNLTSALAALRG